MDLLKELIVVSEKAANVARLCRQNEHLFQLLIQKKSSNEANPRFVEDFKTLADVLIQQMVIHDIGNKFLDLKDSIFGEENNTFRNKLGETIAVEIKSSREETSALLKIVLNDDKEAADLLATEVHQEVLLDRIQVEKPNSQCADVAALKDLGIWIDPIDSTAEYINAIEEFDASGISISGLKCVTVLIGAYDKITGLPVLGVVNQPFFEFQGRNWSGRCFWGLPNQANVPHLATTTKTICVSSSENQGIIQKLREAGYNIIEASGAGYKILTVITGEADAYILSKDSTFKWDTCGPQAILRALSGDIINYESAFRGIIKCVKYGNREGSCNTGGIIAFRDQRVFEEIMKCLT